MGTAAVQGELWGAKAEDWAALQEPAWHGVFETALAHAGVAPGCKMLDVGCGAGGALAIARRRGAEISGLDGAANFVAIARRRLPGARIEVGDMEALPFADESFDVVTGLNAFQFAGDLGRALGEARRVLRRGGTLVMLHWGAREDCELMTVTMAGVLALLPPPPAGTAPGPLSEAGRAEAALRAAGLDLVERGEFSADLAFPDAAAALRATMSAGITVRAARVAGEETVRAVIARSLPKVTRPDGSVVWTNKFQWLKAHRPADEA